VTKHRKKSKPKQALGIRAKIAIWLCALVVLTCAQFAFLNRVNAYLGPSDTPSTPPDVKSAQVPKVKKPPLPPDAVMHAYSSDNQELAYTTADHQLVVVDANGTQYQQSVTGDVTYLQWLGESGTLLYFVQNTYLDAYLLQSGQSKPVLIHEWFGTNRTVTNTYFSPYLEYLYIELRHGTWDEVYKFDAVSGVESLPLPEVQITSIQYDDKLDVMTLNDAVGNVWTYKNDKLYKNGLLYHVNRPMHRVK
jgi:hypothetical protein